MEIKKAVFPVAGMGTRFLPATKANPKEMLPIVDKPLIQYAVEAAIQAGITEMIFVTSSRKHAIEDHFDHNYELANKLQQQHKYELLKVVEDVLPRGIHCVYVRQPEALGLGHAVLCAHQIVGNEPFAVILADDLIYNPHGNCLVQMVEHFAKVQTSIIGVESVPEDQTHKYGIIDPVALDQRFVQIKSIIEKPVAEQAPSHLAAVGRYVLMPDIFPILAELTPGIGGEIQLTDAIAQLAQKQAVYAYEFAGVRYDCGSKLGYLKAVIEYGLMHKELGTAFAEYCHSRFAE